MPIPRLTLFSTTLNSHLKNQSFLARILSFFLILASYQSFRCFTMTEPYLSGPSRPPNRILHGPKKGGDWGEYYELFYELYYAKRRPLPEVMDVMKREHGFIATYA